MDSTEVKVGKETEEERDKRLKEFGNSVVARLTERGHDEAKCPICRHDDFVLQPGMFAPIVQPDLTAVRLIPPKDGRAIPMVAVICRNCGFVMFHALGAIGMMPESLKRKSVNSSEVSSEEPGA